MTSPWGKIQPAAEARSLDEITAEEMVKSLQAK